MSSATQPTGGPPQRMVSPVGSKWQLFKTPLQRNLMVGTLGVGILGMFGMAVESFMQDPTPHARKREEAPSRITQQVPNPPAFSETAPDKPMDKPATVDKPKTEEKGKEVAPPPVPYTRFPVSSGSMVFDLPPAVKAVADKTAGGEAGGEHAVGKTTVAFKPAVLAGAKAGPALNQTYLMRPQVVPCVLDSAMDSTLSGAIFMHTTADVLSPGHVLLMPAGTQVVGTYTNNVRNGQQRVFGFAGSAFTPEGIPVPLDSQIGDSMARNGIAGEVDSHWGEKFGASIALMGFDAATSVLQTSLSKQGQTSLNIGGGGGSGATGLANQILQEQIRIPPTVYVPAGTAVSLIVDHPISFEDAIRVEAR